VTARRPKRVREIAPRDRPEWLRMRRALWPDCGDSMHELEMGEYGGPTAEWAVLVIAREGDGLGGFIELSVRDRVDGSTSPRVAYVEGWYVDPDLRGAGLGRELMARAEAWARSRGLSELASDAELDNPGSIRAHRALGFAETFRLVHFLKRVDG
jgi:aminoglycoside 6'-N-acetyltransferase I